MPVRSVRRRYLLVHIKTHTKLDSSLLDKVIQDKIHYLYGVTGAVEMNSKLIEYFPDKNNAIIRCNHVMFTELRIALAHISDLSGEPIRVDVIRASGTIKSLKKHFE